MTANRRKGVSVRPREAAGAILKWRSTATMMTIEPETEANNEDAEMSKPVERPADGGGAEGMDAEEE